MIPIFDPPVWLRRWWLKREIPVLREMERPSGILTLPWFEMLPLLGFLALLLVVPALGAFVDVPADIATISVVVLAGPPAIYLGALFWGWGQERRALATYPTLGQPAENQVKLDAFALRERRQAELDLLAR